MPLGLKINALTTSGTGERQLPSAAALVPGAGLEPARPFGQRILGSVFAQIQTNLHKLKPIRSITCIVSVRVLLFRFEYLVGQFWDKSILKLELGGSLNQRQTLTHQQEVG